MKKEQSIVAFSGPTRLATGPAGEVLTRAITFLNETSPPREVLFFDNQTGRQLDFDLRGSAEEVVARAFPEPAKKGPGRPRMGVVCSEVCLLPRHWDWLEEQPQRASGTIRRLVEQARRTDTAAERDRQRIDAAFRVMSALAGNLVGFEEASRALYAKKWAVFDRLTSPWPGDIREHLDAMLAELKAEAANAERAHLAVLPRLEQPTPADGKTDPWRLGALELARAISLGTFQAVEVVASYLSRIKHTNERLNAIITLFEDDAMRAAEAIDGRRAAGEAVGPLAGVPFTVKGNVDVAGNPTTNGIPAMRDAVPGRDAPAVERLRRAGAIPLGHTNLPDLSLRFHTASSLYGHTRNPWGDSLSPGGSSGGEGAAIASGMSALGIGNDAGGSVRIPANFCGIAGLKPSLGRIASDRGTGPRDVTLASQLIPVEGLLARSVADLHLAYQISAGPDTRDPRAVPAPLFQEVRPSPTRVAVVESPGGLGVADSVRRAVADAAEALAFAGYDVVPADVPMLEETVAAYGTMIMSEFSLARATLERLLGADGKRYIEFAISEGVPADLAGYLGVTAKRQGLAREWATFFETYPLMVGPVFTDEIVAPDYDIRGLEEYRRVARAMRLCQATSFVGLPAIALPTGVSAGVPRGVQIVAGAFREDRCFEAASVIEATFGRIAPIDPR